MGLLKQSSTSRTAERKRAFNDTHKYKNSTLGTESGRLPLEYGKNPKDPKSFSSNFDHQHNGVPIFVNGREDYTLITEKAQIYADSSTELNNRLITLAKTISKLGDSYVMQLLSPEGSAELMSKKKINADIQDDEVKPLAKKVSLVLGWGDELGEHYKQMLQYCKYLHHFSALPSIINNLPDSIDKEQGLFKLGLICQAEGIHTDIKTKVEDPTMKFNFEDK
jgi:hypothetical protein